MADFFQNSAITTLHKLRERPIEDIEQELTEFSRQRPMALILPSLYSELEGDALPAIVEHLSALGVTAVELLPVQHKETGASDDDGGGHHRAGAGHGARRRRRATCPGLARGA